MFSDKQESKLTIPAISQWVKCADALPPERKNVLIYATDGVHIGRLERDTLSQKLVWDLQSDFKPQWEVSHWMPLPSNP